MSSWSNVLSLKEQRRGTTSGDKKFESHVCMVDNVKSDEIINLQMAFGIAILLCRHLILVNMNSASNCCRVCIEWAALCKLMQLLSFKNVLCSFVHFTNLIIQFLYYIIDSSIWNYPEHCSHFAWNICLPCKILLQIILVEFVWIYSN